MSRAVDAAWLDPRDDVATALRDLPVGARITVTAGAERRDVVLVEPIALGHKFAVRGIAAGRRVRKYGECIGRVTRDVAAGAWVHVHNLATAATRSDADDHAWRMQAAPADGVRVLAGATCAEGASPVYDEINDHAYWLDAGAPVLHVLARGAAREIALPQPAHVIVLLDDGTLALGTRTGFLCVDPASGACRALPGAAPLADGARWTGAACDEDGRLWLAAADPARADAAGSLSSLPPRAAPMRAAPTGLAATRDGRSLLVVDGACARVERRDLDANGGLAASHMLADAGALPGDLWGAALDVDGKLWCALRDAGCVVRFASDGGLERVVRLPVMQPTACTFAGPGLRELIVTSARDGTAAAGHTLALDVGVAGLAPRRASHTTFAATP